MDAKRRAAQRLRSAIGLVVLLQCGLIHCEMSQLTVQQGSLRNVVQPESAMAYPSWQDAPINGTMQVFQIVLRFKGARFVPFTATDQRTIVQAIRDVVLVQGGAVQLSSYREVVPDLAAPEAMRDSVPSVEFSYSFWAPERGNSSAGGSNWWDATQAGVYALYVAVFNRLVTDSNWTGISPPDVVFINVRKANYSGPLLFTLHPIIAMTCQLAVTLLPSSSPGQERGPLLSQAQVEAVSQAVEAAVVGSVGTLSEIVGHPRLAEAPPQAEDASPTEGPQMLVLEVTLFMCKDDATVPSPECERQVLEAVLSEALGSAAVLEQLRAAGILSVEVAKVSPRPPPSPPPSSSSSSAQSAASAAQPRASNTSQWAPWHLDRLNQRSLPLDGTYSATADGSGVNVYIISSGIYGGHAEFKYPGNGQGSRVKAAWGYLGYEPLEDCGDHFLWFGFGTYAASLCCGLNLGPAKNTTIHSVRWRKNCIGDPLYWDAGGLPPALDRVLSNAEKPALLLIDSWWSIGRTSQANPGPIYRDITQRLSQLAANNITVVAAAGPESDIDTPCNNVFAAHPAVISVGATDIYDQVTAWGPTNSPCIDIWAPSGGIGTGLIGASPGNESAYTRVINRAFASAALVAGVAAQYLEQHPTATPAEVKAALLVMSTPGVVVGVGPASNATSLLFSNLTDAASDMHAGAGPSGHSGLATGAVVGIAVGASCMAALAAFAALVLRRARRRRRMVQREREGDPPQPLRHLEKSLRQLEGSGWEIPRGEIEILRRPDGLEWLLGEGTYGEVYKAVKGGVQVVAVKKVRQVGKPLKDLFVKEIDRLRFLSRDANIVPFYGAVVEDDHILLVTEYLEGGDLREALSHDPSGELQWRRRGKGIMLDIVRGVHFLHANHVVHWDIKSKNILLGRDGRAKVADVGMAQLLDLHTLSQGRLKGTMAWAAPEVLLGEEVTAKADIFSLGVVLWEIVTQNMPLRGRLREPLEGMECPREVATIIDACMQSNPSKRPTAKELYTMLIACPAGEDLGTSEGTSVPGSSGGGVAKANAEWAWWLVGERSTSRLATSGGTAEEEMQSTAASSGSWQSSGAMSSVAEVGQDTLHFAKGPHGQPVLLGAGACGSVYKVLLGDVEPLAAKAVELGEDPGAQQAFLQGASLWWRLRHKNVVALSGVSIIQGRGYLLMELMEGGSLHSTLQAKDSATEGRALSWYNKGQQVAMDVAMGLHFLHGRKMAHFDLNAHSVLLAPDMSAKISITGLARVLSRTACTLSSSREVGPESLAYMAPELVAGSKCSNSVDIFAYGVLLWAICTGQQPTRGSLRSLDVPKECPLEVSELFHKCTAPDPASRPSARDLIVALSLVKRHQHFTAPPVNPFALPNVRPWEAGASPF